MPRYPRYGDLTYAIGPGPWSPAVKILIITNVIVFLVELIVPAVVEPLGLQPAALFGELAIWQPVTYMFLHGSPGHLLVNMLTLWMFGTDLERTWGTRFFTKYYFVCGLGAAATTVLWAVSPLPMSDQMYNSVTIGASGATFGILLAFALYFPHRQVLFYFIFPIPAKYFVMIVGALVFLTGGPGIAHGAHLGGLVFGYVYLKGLRIRPFDELKYRWLRWRMNRAKNRFGVYSGGRRDDDSWKSDWKKHIH